MRYLDLNRLTLRLFRGRNATTAEEKAPFAFKSDVIPDSGSTGKSPSMLDIGASKPLGDMTGSTSSEVDTTPLKMTAWRKLAFVLSFNTWILYFAALMWWVPCRQHGGCMQNKNWTLQLEGRLTTNMEVAGIPSHLLFGYSDELGGHLASLATESGELAWNRSTDSILKHVFCNFRGERVTANSGVTTCIATAYDYVGAFSLSDGATLWERRLTDPSDEVIHRISHSSGSASGIFGVGDEFLFVLDPANGSILSTVALPCSWTIDVKLVGPWSTSNGTAWIIVCQFGDLLEVWTFDEGEVLSPPPGLRNRRSDVSFGLLFSLGAGGGGGSIDLAGDVTQRGDSIALSWADRVAMVTRQTRSGELGKTWEKSFPGKLVTSISFGYFTVRAQMELAVTTQEDQNATLYILDPHRGSTKATHPLGWRSVLSTEKVMAGKRTTDSIVMEAISHEENTNGSATLGNREFSMLKYTQRSKEFQQVAITTTDAYASIVTRVCEGEANLILANQAADSETTLTRFRILNGESQCNPNAKAMLHIMD